MKPRALNVKRHPLSALFERFDLDAKGLKDLADDIAHEGLLSPITTHEGMVLDGWNRYQACKLAKAQPVFIDLQRGLDPWEFVKGSNMLRRHMQPAERVAVMLLKMQMDGGSISTPSLNEIEKDLEVSRGTAVLASQVAKAHDPELNEALADKRVSLDQAAKIAKLPKEERTAALADPKPAPAPKNDDRDARIVQLENLLAERDQTIEELRDRMTEMADLLQEAQTETESIHRILDADDLQAAFKKEVVRFQELARVTQSRNNGLMNENADLTGRLKSALRKIERLEKKGPKLVTTEEEEINAAFGEGA